MKSNIFKLLISLLFMISNAYAQEPQDVKIFNVVATYDDKLAAESNYINAILMQIATANLVFERSGLPIYLNLLDAVQRNDNLLKSNYTNETISNSMESLETTMQIQYPEMNFWVHFTSGQGYELSNIGLGTKPDEERFSLLIKQYFVGHSVVRILPWLKQLSGCQNENYYGYRTSESISTFAHEVGHNFGMNHDKNTDPADFHNANNASFGFGNPNYHTIMAYSTSYPGAQPSFTFSSPRLMFHEQYLGSKKENVVDTLWHNAKSLYAIGYASREDIQYVESEATHARYRKIQRIIKLFQSKAGTRSKVEQLCAFKNTEWGDDVSSFSGETNPIAKLELAKKRNSTNQNPDESESTDKKKPPEKKPTSEKDPDFMDEDQDPATSDDTKIDENDIQTKSKAHAGAIHWLHFVLLACLLGWRQRRPRGQTSCPLTSQKK